MSPRPLGLERYQILGEHGRGGLGRVSRAHDRDLGRDVAIKELLAHSQLSEARFLREALITARLEHPGIVPVHEAGRWIDGTPFYAMKLVAGRPLRDLIAERKTVEERIALLHHVIAVGDALAYAHGRNIIHRDLKPANVIVGDFGETVVIDWGLAKDLSAHEDLSLDAGPFREVANDYLTRTGSVLGTPAYMPPEQERGEQVDQRADVFAIGAMLWELCSLEKVPPTEPRLRHRILRRAGIDRDLITILDKSLDPDPANRYLDASALAADLKAFKAGARISARSYSLFASLAHWVRRHRPLTLSVLTVAALAIAGIVIYVRDITTERDHADTALAQTQSAKDDLTLEHAELLLDSDPTAALAVLSGYRGTDEVRRRRLLAKAKGLGVASQTITAHSDTIWFLLGLDNGDIVSLGEDGRIYRTHDAASTPLVTDVSLDVQLAYAPARDLLAYATEPMGISLLSMPLLAVSRISEVHPIALQFAPDGSRLAAISDAGELIVWSLAAASTVEIYRAPWPRASQLQFSTPTRLVFQQDATLRSLTLDATDRSVRAVRRADVSALHARPDAIAIGTEDGMVELRSPTLALASTTPLCLARVNTVLFLPGKNQVAFACRDGHSGIAHFDSALSRLQIDDAFPTRGSTTAFVDPTGQYVMLIDESHSGYMYGLATRIMHRYDGHAGRLNYMAAPTARYHHGLTGDENGTIRVWDPPAQQAHAALQLPISLFALALSNDGKILLVNGYNATAYGVDLETGSRFTLAGSSPWFSGTIAPDRSSLLMYSQSGDVRVWSYPDRALLRAFHEHAGGLGEVEYRDPQHIVSVADDGRLLEWSPNGTDVKQLFRTTAPLRRLEVLSTNQHVIVDDSHGAIWDVAAQGVATQVRAADGATPTILRASPDGKLLALGTDDGRVEVYDTATWHKLRTLHADGGIRQLAFDPLDRDLLIASEARSNQLGHVHILMLDPKRAYAWNDVPASVRNVAYSPDGNTLGFVCVDGGVWLYSIAMDAWVYANDGHTDTLEAAFSGDGRLFVSVDGHGTAIVRDVATSFDSVNK